MHIAPLSLIVYRGSKLFAIFLFAKVLLFFIYGLLVQLESISKLCLQMFYYIYHFSIHRNRARSVSPTIGVFKIDICVHCFIPAIFLLFFNLMKIHEIFPNNGNAQTLNIQYTFFKQFFILYL